MKADPARRSGPQLTFAVSLAALSLTAASAALAQPRTAPPAGATAKPAVAAAAAEGTTEDKLMGSMASREMTGLLEHYFKKHNVPEDKRATIKSIVAWNELRNPSLTNARRRQLILDGVRGVQQFINQTNDTELLMKRAFELIEHGMKSQVNQIEYFGESPSRQADLNGPAEAVIKIFDKTIAECEVQQNQVLAGQVRPNQQLLNKWQALDERLQNAKWTKAFASYGLALSLDPASPRRKEIAEAALVFLKDFEDPQFQREAMVKNQMGKLNIVKGDTEAAIAKFAEASKVKGIDLENQYNALFFTTLAHLTGKNLDAAAKSLDELQKWVEGNIKPEDKKTLAAGIGLLDYRINDARAEAAKAPADKKKYAEAGEAALNKLMKDNPALEPVIKKMLLAKLPPDADLAKLDTVLLRALLAKGVDEVVRAREGLADDRGKPDIERAIQAVAEIQKRKGQPNVTDDVLDESAFLEPIFWSKLGKNLETVEESLDYLTNFKGNRDRSANALNNALIAVEALRKSPESTGVKAGEAINRTWQIAVASGMKEYTFMYGKRLYDQQKWKEAVAVLRQVPPTHPAITHAKFFELSATQELLDDKSIQGVAKQNLVADIQKLAADVNQRIDADLANATDVQKPRLRYYQVIALLRAAELKQREMKDNQGALTLLAGLEDKVKDLPGEGTLVGTALRIRVNAYMALGKTQEAVDEVQKLVAQGGTGSATILYTLVQQMDQAYIKAKAAKDTEAMQQNSRAQVALIGSLIQQTKDPKAKDAYEEWEAKLLIQTAQLETDQAKRTEYLTKAQGVFARQMGKEKEGAPKFDNYRYQLALISYELKDYKKVQQELGQLIAEGKLGTPDIRESDPATGTETFRENGVYWEGLLRFMQSNVALAKSDPSPQLKEALENAQSTLKTLYINRGKNVGGERLREEYAALKAEILPGWDETKAASATRPTTQAAVATPK